MFLEEQKFYASRASNVKLIFKLLALGAATKEGCEYTRLFFLRTQHQTNKLPGTHFASFESNIAKIIVKNWI